MGNDGGVIATKRYLIKTAKPEHARAASMPSRDDIAGSRLTTCALSSEPLRAPCVADAAGNIFNKEALLAAVLEKRLPPAFSHVRKFSRDTFAVRPNWCGADATTSVGSAAASALEEKAALSSGTSSHALFTCPVTGVAANGRHVFVALRGCGCVVAAKALDSMSSSTGAVSASCPSCGVVHDGVVRLAQTATSGPASQSAGPPQASGSAAPPESMPEGNCDIPPAKRPKTAPQLSSS